MLKLHSSESYLSKALGSALKAAGDETRLRILHILSFGSFSVNEITEILGMGQSRISRHLKIMNDAGLLESLREGTWVYYKIPEKSAEINFSRNLAELILAHKEDLPKKAIDQKEISDILKKREEKKIGYFNKIGKNLDRVQSEVLNPRVYREKILSFLPPKNKMIIDLGCGPGGLFPYLLKKSDRVTGIDSSVKMVDDARSLFKENKKVNIVHSYLEKLPISSNFANAVVASMVLHHVSNPRFIMEEAGRVLKDEGVFCIIDLKKHNAEFMRDNFADLWLGFDENLLGEWLKASGFDVKKKEEIQTQSEFKIIAIKAIKKGGRYVHSNKRTNTKV